jgi:hypothetical protein
MTTAPSRLIDRLPSVGFLDLRFTSGKIDRTIAVTEAVALAIRGSIEGVGPPSGKIVFLRWLKDEARPGPLDDEKAEDGGDGGSTAFARTNMGVYREPMRSAVVREDVWGNRVVQDTAAWSVTSGVTAPYEEPNCEEIKMPPLEFSGSPWGRLGRLLQGSKQYPSEFYPAL